MDAVFSVDGIRYNVTVPAGGIKRSASVLDGDNAGRVKSGLMIRDIIGTYYNYTVQIETSRLDVEAYDRLYEVLTAPVNSHLLVIPYGQTTLRFYAYVTNAEDSIRTIDNGKNFWGGLSINFIAMEPQRR